jgi:ribosomal protein S18 acetylase RimI-like enzyme
MIVRQLVADDAEAFRSIRLDGLREAPEAFGSTYDAESGLTVEAFAHSLTRSYVAGAHIDGALVGVAGFYVLEGPKTSHRGNIWGVYVRPAARARGVGGALIGNVLAHAAQHVLQVHLSVVTENRAVVAFYQRLGFAIYGTEPRSLKVGDRFYDEHLMVRQLDRIGQ